MDLKNQNKQKKLPKLPKKNKSLIIRCLKLGRLKNIKLPISYLSYLNYLGRLVSSGKWQVSTPMPMNRAFGRLGKIFREKKFKKNIITFSILFLFLFFISCGTQMHSDSNKNAIAGQQEDNTQNYRLENAEFLELKDDLEKNENTE